MTVKPELILEKQANFQITFQTLKTKNQIHFRQKKSILQRIELNHKVLVDANETCTNRSHNLLMENAFVRIFEVARVHRWSAAAAAAATFFCYRTLFSLCIQLSDSTQNRWGRRRRPFRKGHVKNDEISTSN